MHDVTGLRERKKAEVLEAISTAALGLAVERGPSAVTVDDIAVAAGVSARTVFNYFPTKEAAILGSTPEQRAEVVRRLEDRPASEGPLLALREAIRDASRGPAARLWRVRARLAYDHPQLQSAYLAGYRAMEDDLTAVVAQRCGLDPGWDAYPRLVVTVAAAAMRVAVDHAIAVGDTADHHVIDDMITRAFEALAAGLPEPTRTAA